MLSGGNGRQLPRAVLLESGYDADALRSEVEAVPRHLWAPIVSHRNLAWYGVALRSADGDPSTMGYGESCVDTPLMDAMPETRSVVGDVGDELLRVRLLALQPGADIGTHVDEPAGERKEARLHLPITTNPEASFSVEGEEVTMGAGELWWFNVGLPHSARNRGDSPRVHLVIDCVHGVWLDGRLP